MRVLYHPICEQRMPRWAYPFAQYYHSLCCWNWKKKRCRWRFRPNFVPSKAVVLLLLIHSLMFLLPLVCRGSVFGPRFAIHYLVFCPVLQSSWRGRESMMPYSTVFLLLVFCGCSSRCKYHICEQRMIWRSRTFAQSRQSLRWLH